MSADNGTQYLSVDAAVCMLRGGCRFGDVQEQVAPADRDALKRAFVLDPDCGPEPKGGRKPLPRCNSLPPTGNGCKTCGGMMVRGGKCEYCPNGCGSEGECS